MVCPTSSRLTRLLVSVAVTALLAAGLFGCSKDPDPRDTGTVSKDTATDASDAADSTSPDTTPGGDADAGDASDTADDADGGSTGALCDPCQTDEECGGADDRCLTLPDNQSVCTRACDPMADQPNCPDTYNCATVDSESGEGQCVPEQLTCVDRCSDTNCSGDETCNPLNGQCEKPLGLCETGCALDSMCGDGPEDICVTVPNTSDNERMCATGCNPEADSPSCPVDYSCVPLDPEGEPDRGICFPIKGTCRDRCANADCADDENCNVRTGNCEEAKYGACQKGCQNSAECGGQQDLCLDLGIGQGSHCWLDCSDSGDECPNNYQCNQLTGTTLAICIPESMRCEECYGTSCFPGGACDPVSGMCTALKTDCTQTGCPQGQACDPRSTECVDVGRSCSGDSWASDCDNIVTACTSRRSGTAGSCEKICASTGDCDGGESCVATNLRQMCLGSKLGGPRTCGTLHPSSTDIGAPCDRDSDCSGGATTCVEGGEIEGFCSKSCQSDTDCGSDQRCGAGPDGNDICIPRQCECAAAPGFGGDWSSAFDSALQTAGLDRCDLWLDPASLAARSSLNDLPLVDGRLADRLALPLRAFGQVTDDLAGVDAAADNPKAAVEAAAAAAGSAVTGQAGSYSFGGNDSKLTQAVVQLIQAAGGTANTTQLEMAAQGVPAKYQDLAAPIIASMAKAYQARETALSGAGWGMTRRQEAFDGAPYLFLPGTSMQTGGAPDLSDPMVRSAYADFPDRKFAQTAADLAADVDRAVGSASGTAGWTGFSYAVDTPAGKVVLGGAGDTVYDPSQNSNLTGDIALIIDAGGSDTYRLPVGANTSVDNGVALLVDLGDQDTYTYPKVGHSRDTMELMTSDADGRKMPAGSLTQGDGPVSLSATARQGAGRVGIGMLLDYGSADDTYESLRMSQGAAIFGFGLLFDEAGNDTFDAEALAQGAAIGGIGTVWNAGGVDDYRVWHAGQGFGTAAGTGLLFDRSGGDTYTAVAGQTGGSGVLYYSPADRGASNRNLAQGAAAGVAADSMTAGLAGGTGLLRDAAGDDTYAAGTYAQGYGTVRGLGVLSDGAGSDGYGGRVLVQGVGQEAGGGILTEQGGADTYNANTTLSRDGQGFGEAQGWGLMWEASGDDDITYGNPGGGVGIDGGYGFAFFGDGQDEHSQNSQAGWGFAQNSAMMGDPLAGATTLGFFVDVGSDSDTYSRPNVSMSGIGDDASWSQPDPPTSDEKGVGTDG